ncbi:hypothetical protein, partial [uncultured Dubosiella sp.]|uniref:hypothetical protein n=1 Tax=uncultured Dubosiella sp. TaxID=1937011 RepID=UPI00272AE77F
LKTARGFWGWGKLGKITFTFYLSVFSHFSIGDNQSFPHSFSPVFPNTPNKEKFIHILHWGYCGKLKI